MDMSPLMDGGAGEPVDFVRGFIERFSREVEDRLSRLK
jgi:hypothetical protein